MFSLKSVATVGGLTLASRALGFLREVLIARLIGTSPVAEAFFVAMRLPNLFRQLFAEGAFNSAFVPMFARQLEEGGPKAAKLFAEHVLGVLLMVLLLVTMVAELTMPFLIRVFAPGFHEYPEKFQLAVLYTQITFPYLVFMSLGALQGGILNAFGRFADAAAAPILLNVVLIVVLFGVVPYTGHTGEVLSIAVTVAPRLGPYGVFTSTVNARTPRASHRARRPVSVAMTSAPAACIAARCRSIRRGQNASPPG